MAKPQFERSKPHVNIGTVRHVAVVAVPGLVAGATLGLAGIGPGRTSSARTVDAVALYTCPDGATIGRLHRSDRVFATGQGAGGEWIEIRSPADLDARVWVQARHLVPDDSFAGLPEAECFEDIALPVDPAPVDDPLRDDPEDPAAPSPDPTAPPATPTTSPPPGAATPSPTPTAPPSDPEVGSVSADPSTIWENHSACDAPTTSRIAATVSDPSGIRSVELRWNVRGQPGSRPMQPQGGGRWGASLGPFPSGTVSGNDTSAPITVTVVATNEAGRRSSAQTTVTLNRCPPLPQ